MLQHYFDANATTFMPEIVIKTMVKWFNKGNASASYESAQECRDLMKIFRQSILDHYDLNNHTIIFTSGASESNCHIITSSVRAFMNKTGKMPHIIISAVEHKSIMACCEGLKDDGLCQYTKLDIITEDGPQYGTIDPTALESAIKPNTCLISIMTVNNETGIINDIPALAAIAHKHKVPFHSDCVQSFGKYGLYNGVDACSVSFHKLCGPPGLGLLIIRNTFVNGYGLKPLIAGSQNGGLRGGTENIPAIAGSYAAFKYNLLSRSDKNRYLVLMKEYFKTLLCNFVPCFYISEYEKEKGQKNKVFWIANKDPNKVSCNTILLAIYKDNFCNIKMKDALLKHDIIVSVGSACNSSDNRASDVIYALKIAPELRSGVLRISFLDTVTKEQINHTVTVFTELINQIQQ